MIKVIEIIDSDDDSHTATSSSNTSLVNNMEQDDNQQCQSRRRRRKSALHAMADPDMQFQTITLEDDDDDVDINTTNQVNPTQRSQKHISSAVPASRTLLKTLKVAPKILAPKAPTNAEIVDTNFEKFINDPETANDIYAIAEERARVNYLLAVNGMPEINFTLYTRPDRLQFQFEERLKQRKMVNNWDSTRLLENRCSFPQKNDE